jgi:hypothetical protein
MAAVEYDDASSAGGELMRTPGASRSSSDYHGIEWRARHTVIIL